MLDATLWLARPLFSLPGFLANIKVIEAAHVAPFLLTLYSYAWFVGFGLSFVLYIAFRKLAPNG